MLNPNEKQVLREMMEEIRAMLGKESEYLMTSGAGRIPGKSLAQLNLMYLTAIFAMLERLAQLNEGEFARFVEMWPRIWGRLFTVDPPFADDDSYGFPDLRGRSPLAAAWPIWKLMDEARRRVPPHIIVRQGHESDGPVVYDKSLIQKADVGSGPSVFEETVERANREIEERVLGQWPVKEEE